MKKMKKKKNGIFFFIFLQISKKKASLHFGLLTGGGEGGRGTKRPFRGLSRSIGFVHSSYNVSR